MREEPYIYIYIYIRRFYRCFEHLFFSRHLFTPFPLLPLAFHLWVEGFVGACRDLGRSSRAGDGVLVGSWEWDASQEPIQEGAGTRREAKTREERGPGEGARYIYIYPLNPTHVSGLYSWRTTWPWRTSIMGQNKPRSHKAPWQDRPHVESTWAG